MCPVLPSQFKNTLRRTVTRKSLRKMHATDLDHDGLTNLDEYLFGTGLNDADSDNDGDDPDPLVHVHAPVIINIIAPLLLE